MPHSVTQGDMPGPSRPHGSQKSAPAMIARARKPRTREESLRNEGRGARRCRRRALAQDPRGPAGTRFSGEGQVTVQRGSWDPSRGRGAAGRGQPRRSLGVPVSQPAGPRPSTSLSQETGPGGSRQRRGRWGWGRGSCSLPKLGVRVGVSRAASPLQLPLARALDLSPRASCEA